MGKKIISESKIWKSFKRQNRAMFYVDGEYALITNGAYLLKIKRSRLKKGGRLDRRIDAAEENHELLPEKTYKDFSKYFYYKEYKVLPGKYIGTVENESSVERPTLDVVEHEGFETYFDPNLVDIITDKQALLDGVFTDESSTRTRLSGMHYEKYDRSDELILCFFLLPVRPPEK